MRTLMLMNWTYRCAAKLAARLRTDRRTIVLVAFCCLTLLARELLFGGLTKRTKNIEASSQPSAAAGKLGRAAVERGQNQHIRLDNAKIEVNFGVEQSVEEFRAQSELLMPRIPPTKEHIQGPTPIVNLSLLAGFQTRSRQDVQSSKKPLQARSIGDENNANNVHLFDKLVSPRQLVGKQLSVVTGVNHVRTNKTLKEAFRPLLSARRKANLLRCLHFLANKLLERKIAYFLYSGSLLGAHRHRGMIPWDDDVDIIANFSQAAEIAKALGVSKSCKLLLEKGYRYKLYPANGDAIPRRQWKWPFIDIFFFNETRTHLYDMTPMPDGVYSFAKSDVFPLAYKPFEGIWLPVPAEEEKVIALDFHEDLCKTGYYSHRYEADIPDDEIFSVPCAKLYDIHPFIFRTREGNMIKELLRVGGTVLSKYAYPLNRNKP